MKKICFIIIGLVAVAIVYNVWKSKQITFVQGPNPFTGV